tara:strand:- start:441 stop:623 length:183 start_codon:yes stop_codon:yes gene_type:complete
MKTGDLVKIKNNTFLAASSACIGIVVDAWNLNNCVWLRVLWNNGMIDPVVCEDVELIERS